MAFILGHNYCSWNGQGVGVVVGATANYLVSCHLWLPLNWKIEFFECTLKLLRFSCSVVDSCFIGKSNFAANLSGGVKQLVYLRP